MVRQTRSHSRAVEAASQPSPNLQQPSLPDEAPLRTTSPVAALHTHNIPLPSCDNGVPNQVAWEIINSYFTRYGLLRHQTDAYDNFMRHLLPHIIQESLDIRIKDDADGSEHVISLCNVSVNYPMVTEANGVEVELMPHMARLRGITYASNVSIDVVHDIYKDDDIVDRRIYREVLLCSLPVMVGSSCCHTQRKPTMNECRLDQGGYFIISGIEKTLIAQERLRTNVPFVFSLRGTSKYKYVCEIRSCHESKLRSTSTLFIYITNTKRGSMPEMVAFLPFMQQIPIPVLALFRLLRVDTRAEVMRLIIGAGNEEENRLLCSILDNDTTADMNTSDLFEWLGREATTETTKEKRQRYLDHIVSNEFLPHMGLQNTPKVLEAKAAYLGYMVRKLMKVYIGLLQPDDRDHYAVKRVDPSGMGLLFRQLYRSVLKTATAQLIRLKDQGKLKYTNVTPYFSTKRITNSFRYAFSTGIWSMQSTKSSPAQTGIVQMISRMSVVATVSNMRRINTPISREGKAPKPRQLHYTSWGVVCPVETPEGGSCGLIKNLAMMAYIRVGTHSGSVVDHLMTKCRAHVHELRTVSDDIRGTGIPVLVNGVLVGYTSHVKDANVVVDAMRDSRNHNTIPFDTTIAFVEQTIVIDTDPGCLMRPLLVGANMQRAKEVIESCASMYDVWNALLRANVIQYVDKQEEMGLRVGLWCSEPEPAKYSHYELHPSMILGLCAALIPFPDRNQAPRNTYQSAMCKQSMGLYAFTNARRMDTVSHMLCSPERPLVSTRLDAILGISDAPSGINIIVAIMVCGGYNQEDSVILNESAVQRGLFRSIKYSTYRDEERANGADSECFERPDVKQCQGMRIGNYDKLNDAGILPVGSVAQSGDVLVGKTVTTASAEAVVRGQRKTVKRDKSILLKNDSCVVDAVFTSAKPDGSRLVKMKMRSTRAPMVGDKFCLDPGHQVLTTRGWIGVADVTTEDCALTLDPRTGTMAYEKVMETHAFPCDDEPMYEIDSQQVSLKVTLTHRMWIKQRGGKKYEFAYAKEICGKRVSYLKNCAGGLEASQQSTPSLYATPDFLYLFGFWMGNGWTEDDCSRVVICQVKTQTRTNIIECIRRLGFTPVENDDTIHIYDKPLFQIMREHSKEALHKRLPVWTLRLSVESSRHLLQGLMDRGWSVNKGNALGYYTSSSGFADDMMVLALNCGYAANIRMHNSEGDVNWRVEVVTSKCRPTVNHGHIHRQKRQTERIVPYTGSVHCITVRTGVFMVRRNGKGCWTGNSSRMGQKGVVGRMLPQEDMPFTEDGIVPDLIFNPHAIPSRMTLGQLLECLLGKLSTVCGEIGDATPFCDVSIDAVSDALEAEGYDRMGNETMYDGKTGRAYESKVFLGPTYYQRLKHMSQDKAHSRSRGPKQVLTHQPLEGRARDGGLRFGEMERDCLISHGADMFLLERLMLTSDAFDVYVCDRCGNFANPPAQGNYVCNAMPNCRVCESRRHVHKVCMPYACKLLCQELAGMHVGVRLLSK